MTMKRSFILGAALILALSVNANAQPPQPQIVSKADMSTVEFVVRDGKPILMDIYQFKDQETEGKRPVFIYSFGGAWAMGSRVDALCNPLYDHLCEKGWVCVAIRSSRLLMVTILSSSPSTSVARISMRRLHGSSSMPTNTI